jgi:hypothetical protein
VKAALKAFLQKNPMVAWLLTFPAAAFMAALSALVGGADLPTTLREYPVPVIVAAVVIILSGYFATLAVQDGRAHKRRWTILSASAVAVASVVFVTGSALAAPDTAVDLIKVEREPATRAVNVSVNAHDLRGGQRLRVKAVWGSSDHVSTFGHDAKGLASHTFNVGPLARTTRLQVIAFVTGVKGAGDPPPKLSCGDYEFCSETETTVRGVLPDMRASLQGHALKIRVERDPAAPDRLVIVVFRRGREIFKDNPLVVSRKYQTTIPLPTRGGPGTDRVCVVATYRVERIRGCALDPAVARKIVLAPR